MKLKDLIESLKYDDYGNPFNLEAEVKFHTDRKINLNVLSVYPIGDDEVNIDIG